MRVNSSENSVEFVDLSSLNLTSFNNDLIDQGVNTTDNVEFASIVTTGNATIGGNLVVNGTQFISNAETVEVSDNLLLINKGEVGAGVTAGLAGIEVDRGTSTNYQFVFEEATDIFRIGEIGSLQAVATREDSPINLGFAYWDNVTNKFLTKVLAATDVSDFNTAVSANSDVSANTAVRHSAVTTLDSSTIDLTLTGQQISASVIQSGISHLNIADKGINTHAQIDTHISDATIHYTQGDISIAASQISDFDIEVSNNVDVAANTAAKHSAISLASDDTSILSLTGQDLTFNSSNVAKLYADNVFTNNNSISKTSPRLFLNDAGNGSSGIAFTREGVRQWLWYDDRGNDLFRILGTNNAFIMSLDQLGNVNVNNNIQTNGTTRISSTGAATFTSVDAANYQIDNSNLLLNSLKSGSIGPAGTFLKSVGSTVTPDWATLTTNDLSDKSNIAFMDSESHYFSGSGKHRFNGKLTLPDTSSRIENVHTVIGWTSDKDWGGNAYEWGGYLGFNAYRDDLDLKDHYYGYSPYTRKLALEGRPNIGFRFLGNMDISTALTELQELALLATNGSGFYLKSGSYHIEDYEVISSSRNFLGVNQTLSGSLQFADASTSITKDASNNLTFTDAVTGTKTLADIAFLDATTNNFTGEINATKYSLNGTTINPNGTPIQTPTGTSITWDWTQGDWGEITLSGNTTITITNMPAGKSEGLIEITNPASYTVTIAGSTGYTTTEARGSETDAKINGNCTLLYWRVGSTLYYGFLY